MRECCTQELGRKFNLEVLYMEIEQGVSSGGVAYRDGTESLTWKCYIERWTENLTWKCYIQRWNSKFSKEMLHIVIEQRVLTDSVTYRIEQGVLTRSVTYGDLCEGILYKD